MIQTSFQEGELCFEFKVPAEKFDEEGKARPHGMSFVDFVIFEKERMLLLEVKDPSVSAIPKQHKSSQQRKFANKILSGQLIAEELVPKARDSYCLLHLMKRDNQPLVFVVLLGLSALPREKALLTGFKDRLLARLRQETDLPWKREYVEDCIVVSEQNWATIFPNHRLRRIETKN